MERKQPISEFSMAEIKAYNKWSAEQEKIKSQAPKTETNPDQKEEVKETNAPTN